MRIIADYHSQLYDSGQKGNEKYGGLIGEAQGIWDIKNCFTEVDFGQNVYQDWGGLIGKTWGSGTKVNISNCISHMSNYFFTRSGDEKSGGLVGLVGQNSSVTIKSSGVLSGNFYEGKSYRGLLVGFIENREGATLECDNCFIDSKFNGNSDELKKLAFSQRIRDDREKCTLRDIYSFLVNTADESSKVSYYAARMNEKGACLGVQSHGTKSDYRRQYLPLTDAMKGMVVRYVGADNVVSVESKHLQKSYGLYSETVDGKVYSYAMMAVGDTTIIQMKPLTNQWYVKDTSDFAKCKARVEKYKFRMVPTKQSNTTCREFKMEIVNIPKVTLTGYYDPIRQRTILSWIPSYTSQSDYKKMGNNFKWALFRGTTLLVDTLSLNKCQYIDMTPNISIDKEKTLNEYSIALVSKSMFLEATEENASNSHAKCQVFASDSIVLGINGVPNKGGVELSTKIPNSSRFDKCRVNLYRWNTETANTIIKNIMSEQSEISQENLIKAFSDSIRIRNSDVKRMEVGQFNFNAALKDSLVEFKYQDNIEDFSTNHYYVFCCENFQDDYYKQFGVFLSEQYMYIPGTQVKITNLTCSKGESDTKVTVTWKSKLENNGTNVHYRVFRKLYSEDDTNLTLSNDTVGWDLRYNVTNSNSINTYTDETLPGYIYRYRVNAHILRGNEFNNDFIASYATDAGYTSGRGNILGKITYASGGSRVKGVDVVLTTDKESMKDIAVKPKARYFDGKNDYLPLAQSLSKGFWNGDWTVQFILRPLQNGRLVSIPGSMAVLLKDGTLSMAGKTMEINNTQGYNYIILRHSGRDKCYYLGYAKHPDSTEVYAHYVVTVSDSEMKKWMENIKETTTANELAFGCASSGVDLGTASENTHSFKGLLDEVRVWNRQLSEEEVRITFDRYITGYETGLQAYYTFDDGVRDKVYDISHTANGDQNGHHATVVNKDATNNQFFPDAVTCTDMDSVLCYRGTTDANGQYQISGIPYCGEGTNFMVTPIFGTHDFYPTQIRRFVSKSSLVHQDVDFADQSSFRIPVKAVYSGTTMPASGLIVTVDGVPAKNNDGNVVTNAIGQATVSVPIGSHKLRLWAKGHEMANDGYPCNITIDENGDVTVKDKDKLQDKDGYIDFQKDLTAPLTFYDNTRVSLCGHVVGGSVENSKLMGDKSKVNNIGPAIITLESENLDSYSFTLDEKAHDYSALGVGCKVVYKKECIEITTNETTGEYFALLPPIGYRVTNVHSTDVGQGQTELLKEDFALDKIQTSLHFDVNRKYADKVTTNANDSTINAETYFIIDSLALDSIASLSLMTDSVSEENSTNITYYNLKKNFACYVEPTLEVYNAMVEEKDRLMLGESAITIGSGNNAETLTIWNDTTRDGSSDAYNLKMTCNDSVTYGFPVFNKGSEYRLKVKLYDNYVNRKTGKPTQYNLSNVPIYFVNGLASKSFTTIVTNGIEELPDTFSYTIIGDSVTANTSNGVLEYAFTGGFPNVVKPYTQKLEISYYVNDRTYTATPIEGIVIGKVPIPGRDYVTAGPNVVDLVLRDPPGSGSFSWIDAGSTIGSTYTYNHTMGFDGGSTWSIGDEVTTLGFTQVKKTDLITGLSKVDVVETNGKALKSTHDHGFSVSINGGGGATKTVNYTFNDKLQTSASSGYVGEDGDIYIGRSENVFFSETRDLNFHKTALSAGDGILRSNKGNCYQLKDFIGTGSGTTTKTTFAYTQKHIVNTLIPELRKQRNKLCTVVDNFNNLPASVDSTSYFVLRNVSDDIDEWVSDTDYVCVYSSKANQTDTISVINSWIRNWKSAIANNEKTKYDCKEVTSSSEYKDKEASSGPAGVNYTPKVKYGYLGNISLDGGSSKTTTLSRSYTDNESRSIAWTAKQNNSGFKEYHTKYLIKGDRAKATITINENFAGSHSWTNNKTYTQNLGYTISDPVGGDYLSVNTYLPSIKIENTQIGEYSRPSFKEFFVFRLVGGQTRCPYEGPKESLYYRVDNKPVLISDGSISVEVPQIQLGQHVITGVPNGSSVTVPVTLSNTSTATITLAPWYPTFNFQMTSGSNPNGLQLIVDGATLGSSALPLKLGPGQSITKTLEFKQTRLDIMNYDKIALCLSSDCQSTNAAYDTISIEFKPVSSPVTLKLDAKYVNKNNVKSPVNFIIQDYEPTFEKFAGIRLQRKRKDLNEDFSTVGNIIVNEELAKILIGVIPKDAIYIDIKKDTKKVTLPIKMDSISDGTYLYRAVSYSKYGIKEEVQTISDTITVIKDTSSPTLLGKPTPADGYYSNDSEMALLFNENINTLKLNENSIVCKGVLNDAILTHNCGLHFDGNAPAKTSARVNILGKSSTVGFWYKPQVGKRSCLFSQQIVDQSDKSNKKIPIALYYNEDGTMTVYCDGDSVRSIRKAAQNGHLITDWMYAILTINRSADNGNGEIMLFNLFGESKSEDSRFITLSNTNSTDYDCNVPLYIGGSATGAPCHADIEGFVVYDDFVSFADAAADKSNKHISNVRGLRAYWPMDEGHGYMARDKVFSRDLTLQTADGWYSPVSNYALNLNGKDQYLSLYTDKICITQLEDYTIEMWFRSEGDGNNDMALFSCGYGGNVKTKTEVDARKHLSLLIGTKGQIILNATGKTYEMGSGYNDQKWHHLALNVPRDGYVSLLVDTIDIATNVSILGNSLGTLERANMQLGALVYTDDTGEKTCDYFKGRIDEARIWNATMTTRNIKANAFNRLNGDEAGLVAYYPFECSSLVANQQVTNKDLQDRAKADNIPGFTPAGTPFCCGFDSINAPLYMNGAMLVAADFETPVTVEYTTNGSNKIVINFPASLAKYRIEGCTLNFQLKGVVDMAGNQIVQPVNWSVYVRQNTLRWIADDNSLRSTAIGTDNATVYIYNDSKTAQEWRIVNVPSWLNVSQQAGITEPFSYSTISVSSQEGTAIGNYTSTMYLIGTNDSIYEPMEMNLSVTAERPDWSVYTTNGSIWMSIMGRLKIGDTWCTDENSIVAVVDEKNHCLAMASPEYNEKMGTYFVYLNVKGNAAMRGKNLYFRIWDSSTGIIYEKANVSYGDNYSKDYHLFKDKAVLGDFTKPCVISAGDNISQTLALHDGWNWLSMWVAPKVGSTADKVFSPIMDCITEIKTPTGGMIPEQFNELTLNPADSYRIYFTGDTTLSVEGKKVEPDSIQMAFRRPKDANGISWCWIGYPLWRMTTIGEAFADINPVANDIVKSEDAYAMFNGSTWIGNLKYLTPGAGYIYGNHWTNGMDSTWHYPSITKSSSSLMSNGFSLSCEPSEYEDYTFVNVSVVNGNGDLITGFDYLLGAFIEVGGITECRGVADGVSGKTCPISIFGEDGDTYTFKLFNKSDGQVYDLVGTKEYDDITSPQTLSLTLSTTGIDSVDADADDDGDYYNVGGIKVNDDTKQHGVYIKKGKKVLRTPDNQ